MTGAPDAQDVPRGESGRPAIEWVVGIASAALVGALLTFLAYQAVVARAHPADLKAVIERVDTLASGTVVTLLVVNKGDTAAASVGVNCSIPGEPRTWSTRRIEFDYVAGHAVRRGACLFSESAGRGELRVEVSGYIEP